MCRLQKEKKAFRDTRQQVALTHMDARICCDVATDVEWKVKLIVSITAEHRLPLSVSIPIPTANWIANGNVALR